MPASFRGADANQFDISVAAGKDCVESKRMADGQPDVATDHQLAEQFASRPVCELDDLAANHQRRLVERVEYRAFKRVVFHGAAS